jgi:hypothetical protein
MNASNDRPREAGRRVGSCYLDGYERFVGRVIRAQQKLAKQSSRDAVKVIVDTQAGLTRGLSSAYTSAARRLVP